MKVLALAADEGGCGFYRVRAPAAELKLLGVDVTVADGIDATASKDADGMYSVSEIQTDADLIVVQRPLDNAMTAVIRQAQKQGIATVVEIDDDFDSVHRDNVAHESVTAGKATGSQWVTEAASIADLVTVSTPQLTKYARHGRFAILRNYVPNSIFDTPVDAREPDLTRIGWTGTVQTHPNDLQETKGAVATILRNNDLAFNVIGDGKYVASNLGLDRGTEVYSTGWVDLGLYYQYLSKFIDIGIVPLEISPFNQAKSALKGLEYAALGIPFVASPTREYERMEAYGIGKTARNPSEWRRHLQRMLDRPEETERIAEEARGRIEEQFTYRVNAPQWLEAWERAIDYRKTRP